MRAATYGRVSTEEQAQHGTSLDSQRERTLAYVEEREWTHVRHFADEGVSGARESRPALDRLIKACGEGEIDVVVVATLDRFTRDERLWHNWKHLLTGLGVSIVTCDGTVDTSDDESWFTDSVLAAVASKYRRDLNKRTTLGRRTRAKEGIWVGGKPPFGFAVVERRLVLDDDEAATIRRAYDLVLSNRTLHQVADTLNAEGRFPRQFNPRIKDGRVLTWDAQKLRYALTREPLIGRYVYGKTSSVQIPGTCPPVFTRQEWDRLQASLDASHRQVYRGKKIFPLSLRLTSPCGECYNGAYDANLDRRYYRCRGKDSKPRCSCPRIESQPIEDRVFEEVCAFLEDPKRLLRITGLERDDTEDAHREEVRSLDGRIANLSRAITEKAADALEAGLDPTLIAAAVEKLAEDRDALVERRALVADYEANTRERETRRARRSLLTRASMRLVNATLEEKKLLFALLDVQARVTSEGLEIEGVVSEDLPVALNALDVTEA